VACSGGSDTDPEATGESAEPEAPAEWLHLGHDLGNSRATTSDEQAIGPENVSDLQPAWELADVQGVSGTPIVVDGVVYIGDWTGHLRALDAATGDTMWDHDLDTYYIGGAVALDDARVFVATFDARIVALDRATGEREWETTIGGHPASVVFGSPIQVDGLVITGVASAEEFGRDVTTFRGHVVALDAETGEEVWRYWTTDETEEPNSPGVAVWSTPTVDTERQHVYITTGNSYGLEPSDHGDSVIALDLASGRELWINQFTSGDTWTLAEPTGPDADIGAPPNLFQVDDTDAMGVADKAGVYRALDRDTGELLWSQELTEGGLQGGVLASAAAQGGSVYVASNKASTTADLLALDDDTGEVLWRTEVGGSVAGPVSWSNGVVYVGDDSGHVSGFDAEDGERLWSHEVASPAAGGIVVVDGTVYAGWGWWLAAPPDDPQGGLIAFRLDGASEAGGDDATECDEDEDAGASVYTQRCASCHGGSGEGASGPSMVGVADRLTRDEHLEVVREGRGGMPGWENTLSSEELDAVVDYERTVLSEE
jgi:polyvinyl alcohol dehydrogenase (cytochrome)